MDETGEAQDGENKRAEGAGCFLTGGLIIFGVFTMAAIARIPNVDPERNPGAFYGSLAGAAFVGLIFLAFLLGFIMARRKK